MDNTKRTKVGLVHPGTAAKPYRSGRYSVEVVETVAQKKDGYKPTSDSGISEKAENAPLVSLVIISLINSVLQNRKKVI